MTVYFKEYRNVNTYRNRKHSIIGAAMSIARRCIRILQASLLLSESSPGARVEPRGSSSAYSPSTISARSWVWKRNCSMVISPLHSWGYQSVICSHMKDFSGGLTLLAIQFRQR